MTRSLPILALATALAITGCDSGQQTVTAKNATVGEVAEKIAQADAQPRPGRWETTVEVGGKQVAGAGAGAMATCLTAADVADMKSGKIGQAMDSCRYESFTMAGGRIEGVMTCSPPAGAAGLKMKATTRGTYSAEAYDMNVTTEMAMGGRTVTQATHIVSRRVGECNGSELKTPA